MLQNVTFAYPAYVAEPTQVLTVPAQMLGDVDLGRDEQVMFFTMDGKVVTRKISKFAPIQSTWRFQAICTMEEVRFFFSRSEGQYIYYQHYDGSEWVLTLEGASYNVSGAGLRTTFIGENGTRQSAVVHNFDLVVNRWLYA